jgi:hypothetical protein
MQQSKGLQAIALTSGFIVGLARLCRALLNVEVAVERTRAGGAVSNASASQKIAVGRVLGS